MSKMYLKVDSLMSKPNDKASDINLDIIRSPINVFEIYYRFLNKVVMLIDFLYAPTHIFLKF